MLKKTLVCLLLGHKIEMMTKHEFDPDLWEHTYTQVKFCLRCGKVLARVVTKI
jgi:hypothetical protein